MILGSKCQKIIAVIIGFARAVSENMHIHLFVASEIKLRWQKFSTENIRDTSLS